MNKRLLLALFSLTAFANPTLFAVSLERPNNQFLVSGDCQHAYCQHKRYSQNDKLHKDLLHEAATLGQRQQEHKTSAKYMLIAGIVSGLGAGAASGAIWGIKTPRRWYDLKHGEKDNYGERSAFTIDMNRILSGIGVGILTAAGTVVAFKLLQLAIFGKTPSLSEPNYEKQCFVADYLSTVQNYNYKLRPELASWLQIGVYDSGFALSAICNRVRAQNPQYPYLDAELLLKNYLLELANALQAAEFVAATREPFHDSRTGVDGISLNLEREQSKTAIAEIAHAIRHLKQLQNMVTGSYQYRADFERRRQDQEIERLHEQQEEQEARLQREIAARRRAELDSYYQQSESAKQQQRERDKAQAVAKEQAEQQARLEREYAAQRQQALEVQQATYNSFASEKARKDALAAQELKKAQEHDAWLAQQQSEYNRLSKNHQQQAAHKQQQDAAAQERELQHWNEQKRKQDEAKKAAAQKQQLQSQAQAQERELQYWNEQKRKQDEAKQQVKAVTPKPAVAAPAPVAVVAVDCAICLEDVTSDKTVTSCKHTFHKACLDGWKATGKTTCPNCRGAL